MGSLYRIRTDATTVQGERSTRAIARDLASTLPTAQLSLIVLPLHDVAELRGAPEASGSASGFPVSPQATKTNRGRADGKHPGS